jgi:lipopolysaccharide export system ATP-binding protein
LSKLAAAHLRKRYKARTVVHDVSLDVASGEVVGLLGPNGAGKTTCFYMIVGLVAADGGEISLDDENLSRLPIHRRAAPRGDRHRREPRAGESHGDHSR